MKNYVNCTPHVIKVMRDGEVILEVPPSGNVARVAEKDTLLRYTHDGIAVINRIYGDISGLPSDDGTTGSTYIVSAMVLAAAKAIGGNGTLWSRGRMVAPDTGAGAIRDEAGRIIGTTQFLS